MADCICLSLLVRSSEVGSGAMNVSHPLQLLLLTGNDVDLAIPFMGAPQILNAGRSSSATTSSSYTFVAFARACHPKYCDYRQYSHRQPVIFVVAAMIVIIACGSDYFSIWRGPTLRSY